MRVGPGVRAGLSVLATWGLAALGLDLHGQAQETTGVADAAVVLGARVLPDGTPGPSLRARTEHAVELWKAKKVSHLLLTGGHDPGEPSEAAASAAWAERLGVPRPAMVLEERSQTTKQNMAFAAPLAKARGWRRLVVVTDPYHLWRGRRQLARHGFEVEGSPATATPWYWRVHGSLREVLAVSRDLLLD